MLYWYKSTNTDAAAAASPQGKSPRLSPTALSLSRSLSPKHLQHLQQTLATPATSPTAPSLSRSLSPKHLQHLQHLQHTDAIEVAVAGRPQPLLLGVVCPHRREDVVWYSLYFCFTSTEVLSLLVQKPLLLGVICPHRSEDVVRYSLYCCFTAALLLLYCRAAALLLLHSCFAVMSAQKSGRCEALLLYLLYLLYECKRRLLYLQAHAARVGVGV